MGVTTRDGKQGPRALLRGARQQDATVVVLPENFAFMGRGEAAKLDVAEEAGTGPIQDFLAETARQYGFWVVGGTVPSTLSLTLRYPAGAAG